MVRRTDAPMTSLTYIDGTWHEGNPPILGPMSHATWMASVVFDGARYWDGMAPDLDLHCARLIASARAMGFVSPVSADEVLALAWDGIARFPESAELYIRPLIYTEEGFVAHKPGSERFILSVFEEAMPKREGLATCLARWRRPSPESAPTLAKTSALYPNVARILREARGAGFDNALVLDPLGNVAEFATANLFLAKDGAVFTPAPNGTFLAGITRARVMGLLRDDGVEVRETTLGYDDVKGADEVFATGNYSKIMPVLSLDDRHFQTGPITRRAKALYLDFAKRYGRPPNAG
jgi:branched-chain amino acid aminotransferase